MRRRRWLSASPSSIPDLYDQNIHDYCRGAGGRRLSNEFIGRIAVSSGRITLSILPLTRSEYTGKSSHSTSPDCSSHTSSVTVTALAMASDAVTDEFAAPVRAWRRANEDDGRHAGRRRQQ